MAAHVGSWLLAKRGGQTVFCEFYPLHLSVGQGRKNHRQRLTCGRIREKNSRINRLMYFFLKNTLILQPFL